MSTENNTAQAQPDSPADEAVNTAAAFTLSDGQNLAKHALVQGTIALAAFSMWAAIDAWQAVTGLALANILSILTAVIAGLAVSTVVHEWFHFAGAKFGGSSYSIPAKTGFFVYDYDYEKSSLRQFYIMSLAGQLGSVVVVIALFMMIPMDTSGRFMLVSAAVGSAVFGASIEWPVMLRTRESQNPLGELSKITPAVFGRSLAIGLGSGLLFFLLFG